MSKENPHVPPQTITTTSDQLRKEMLDLLHRAARGFRVARAGYGISLRCTRCRQNIATALRADLVTLIDDALEHECEAADA